MITIDENSKQIVLGWKVTNGLDPRYWLGPKPAPGQQKPDDLVTAAPASMAYHTVMVAQSGSGKSYFLGRVLEEIALKTKSKIVVFDPNADFRKISMAIEEDSWQKKAGYDLETRQGFLPDEVSRDVFESRWDKISKSIRTMGNKPSPAYTQLQISWPAIKIDFLSDEVDPALKSELSHCHEVVRTLGELIVLTKDKDWQQRHDLLDTARDIFGTTRDQTEKVVGLQLHSEYDAKGKHDPSTIEPFASFKFSVLSTLNRFLSSTPLFREKISKLIGKIALSRAFVSEEAERVYFSNAYAVKGSGILNEGQGKKAAEAAEPAPRIEVIDIPSIKEAHYRLLAVSTILETIWARARAEWENALDKTSEADERVPTFIVVDEAHNLIPSKPRNLAERRLREQFRTVAAEGRKFGLFLVLVSQRPDKLDALVVSECENRAIMKLGSELVLRATSELLGLGELQKRTLEKCLEFGIGRVLIAGPWSSSGSTFLYSGARRTQEGGRNLRSKFWAVSDLPTDSGGSDSKSEKTGPSGKKKSKKVVKNLGALNQEDAVNPSKHEVPKRDIKRGRANKALREAAVVPKE